MTFQEYLDYYEYCYEKTENGFVVHSSLDLMNDKELTELPDNLKINGYLSLNSSLVTKLPENLSVETLYLTNSLVSFIPESIKVNGVIYMRNVNIDSIPDSLKINSFVITHKGRWNVRLEKELIQIGCQFKTVSNWTKFFKNNEFFQTNPKYYPQEYELIKQDFLFAKDLHKKFFKK